MTDYETSTTTVGGTLIGPLNYWSNGVMECWSTATDILPITPLLHHSIIVCGNVTTRDLTDG